ncbi:MAG: sulfite exporter TauE/SafE family protein [Phycisphaerae bacterium]|nr:sulfite exporter TauE/SafE family protein [Phycisphaerae bacterium]
MQEIALFTAVACLGILVQSFVGFGGALTAVPLFALFLSPKEAIPTYNLVMILIDLWLVFEARRHIQWGRVGRLLLGGFIGVPIGACGLKYLSTDILNLAIGIMTSVFAVFFLLKIKIRMNDTTGTQVGVGLLSGFLGGSIAQAGPPVVIYGLARNWDKNAFRATLLAHFACLRLLAIATYGGLGLFTVKSLTTFAVAIVPAFLASMCGVRFKDRASETFFRQVILVVVVAVGAVNIARSLWPR